MKGSEKLKIGDKKERKFEQADIYTFEVIMMFKCTLMKEQINFFKSNQIKLKND
jgi:hypothetical protein